MAYVIFGSCVPVASTQTAQLFLHFNFITIHNHLVTSGLGLRYRVVC